MTYAEESKVIEIVARMRKAKWDTQAVTEGLEEIIVLVAADLFKQYALNGVSLYELVGEEEIEKTLVEVKENLEKGFKDVFTGVKGSLLRLTLNNISNQEAAEIFVGAIRNTFNTILGSYEHITRIS